MKLFSFFVVLCCAIFMTVTQICAQTSQISYQGTLNASGFPANGSYDLQFKLFDAVTSGSQQGPTNTFNAVTVSNGSFTVLLDFQNAAFPGSNRFLELSVRQAGNGAFTTLLPRTQFVSVPYAIKSVNSDTASNADNAFNLNGVAANQYVVTNDPRLSDPRQPASGSAAYIQNQNAAPQANADFSIDGTGTATNFNAFQFYKINGTRILSGQGTDNFFAGANVGLNNTGFNLAFFGSNAGASNTTGSGNSFFGRRAGFANTTGQSNVFVGNNSGGQNVDGSFNVYVGQLSGQANLSGLANTFVGTTAGASSPTGSNNVAIGADAGNAPDIGSNNTFIGKGAIPNAAGLTFATAIGSGAVVGTSNTISLGRSSDTTVVRGILQVVNGAPGASTAICVNASNQLGVCSSSLRFKSDVESYKGGLNIVRRLRPITFHWKDGGASDVGFAAEEVDKIEPLLASFNQNGEIQGVKYGQVTTVLVNAVKEQQDQIEKQQKQIQQQQAEISVLKSLICRRYSRSAVCKGAR